MSPERKEEIRQLSRQDTWSKEEHQLTKAMHELLDALDEAEVIIAAGERGLLPADSDEDEASYLKAIKNLKAAFNPKEGK